MTRKRTPPESPGTADDAQDPRKARREGRPFPIVGIGASAGGLEAFTELLKHLPADTGMGFVLVQHLDPQHESALTDILGRATSLPVREATNDLRVEADHVYVIAPNTRLGIAEGVLKVEPRAQTRALHRPIDAFFEALAQDQCARAVGVVLSGTASDGTLGLEAIKAEGGITFAQDDSARYDSMPRSAVAAGCVDFVLAPKDIAQELARIAAHPYLAGQSRELPIAAEDDATAATAHEDDPTALPSGGHEAEGAQRARAEAERGREPEGADNGFRKILLLLRQHSGVDFSLYKSSTIQRRITRRLVLSKETRLEDYARFLRGNTKELDALYSDVLISVTSFFRNPEAFDALQREALPGLLQQPGEDPLRAWVLGCSTGQEAYSLAIAFAEAAEKAPRLRKIQIFATDLNDALLDKARHGLYAKSLAEDITPERLRRFFVEEQGGYRINKTLRETVVFARQNLISDPPFSRMDLISCRNLLIYLEPSLQKKAIPTFHYALKPERFLLLGASESIGGFTDLFEPLDKKHKIYVKKAAPSTPFHLPLRKEREERALPPLPAVQDAAGEGVHGELNAQREADRIAVNRFAPPGVLINEQLQILQFRGSTGAYLQPPSGKASFDVLKMARPGLMLPLREAINQAKKENQPARRDNVRIKGNGERRTASVEVIPLKNLRERCFFVLFEDAQGEHRPAEPKPAAAERLPPDEASERIGELETELAETRDYLQSTQEQQEAANEELQAVNEEAQSGNEELQSINEELETSKEELESSNEELATVNEEMVNRNTTLDRLNNDLTNLQTSIRLTIVLLGRDLSIRRFSAHAEKELGLRDSDLGRPIGHIRHNLVLDPEAEETAALDLEHHLEEVIAKVHDETLEVRDKAGRWYSLRLRPYRTVDNKVDGAVLVLMDIDALKRSEQAIAVARDYAENVVETVREPLLVLDDDLRVESANRAFYRTFRVAPAETHGKLIFELGNHQWDIPRLQKLLEQLLPQNTSLEDFEVEHDFEQVGRRTMLLNARRILDPQRKTQRILLAIEDVTEHKAAQAALRESEARFREMIDVLPTAIYTTDTEGRLTHFNPATVELSGHTPKLGTDQWCVSWKLYRADGTPMPHAACAMAVALREERAIHGEEAILERPDGTRRWFVPYPTPLRDAGGRVVGGINMLVDITERKRAEEANVRLAVIVESSDDVIVSKDLEGIIQTWNAGAQRTFGYTAEEAIGQPITMLLPPDRIGEEPGILKRVRRGERVEPFETVRRRKDGTLVDIAVTISPILDAQGRVLGASKIARDITERKRAEDKLQRSEQRYRGLFESARDGILILDAQNMRITDANPSMRNLLSYSLEQLEGKELWEIGLFQNQEESLATIHKLREEGYVRHEDMTLRSAQGAIQNVQLIGNIYRDHGHAFAQCNIRDITERKRMERQIQQQAEELAAAGRRKDEFLAMLSHELRNPLAPILNALQLLGQERDENALHRRARGVIERQVRHLSRLVNELLDVSRITSGRIHLHIERLAVNAVLGRAVERVRPSIDRRGQELSLSLAPDTIWLDADATRLEQVFGNLLDNASKYNADDGHITLSVERDDGQAIIRVRDEGEGIDAATLSHVFELFSQAERSLERSAGGLGIGLALVKSIVELHRGSVEVHSEGLGQGSEFVVRLPLASSQTRPQAAAAPPDTPTDGDSHLRVLVVDDSADAANMATLLLRAWGHEVRVACDGPDALQRAAEFCPQVILLDIGLPGMDGFEVARSIRQDPQFEGVRLVAITGYGQDSDRQRSKEAGFDDHLVKPVEVSDLKALLGGFRQEAVDPEMDPGLRGVTSKSA